LTELRSQTLKEKKPMPCCGDVMKPIEASSCCTAQDTAAHAARAIRDSGCGCAPVVQDTKDLKLVGVVTERDVCCGVAADDRRASEVRVEEIMRPSSACCDADEPVEEGRRKLHEQRATSLPVVDKAGGCCGTVSIHSCGRS
jgi:CBS domain-containing protein